jgi:hypothetical protein
MSSNSDSNTNYGSNINNYDNKNICPSCSQKQEHIDESSQIEMSFYKKAKQFMQKTEQYALQGLNPGGHYQAIWCRDASFILKSWFYSADIHNSLQQISEIWSHQIKPGKEMIVYGRGSPETNYKPIKAKDEVQKKFEGALPTTIYPTGYSEVYGIDPDIDSTALMISTTSWIIAKILAESKINYVSRKNLLDDENASFEISRYSATEPNTMISKVVEFVIPRMLKAVDYLQNRDVDNDGILEQNHNEDWMDTGLRAGKIVYSQSCFILGLNNLSYLLLEIGQTDSAKRMSDILNKTMKGVEEKHWSERDGSYIDILESCDISEPYRTITQDIVFYLVAISENTISDTRSIYQCADRSNNKNNLEQTEQIKDSGCPNQENNNIFQNSNKQHPLKRNVRPGSKPERSLKETEDKEGDRLNKLLERGNKTLDAIKKRVWIDQWPTNIEELLKNSGPPNLQPYHYHNKTFWPWITGVEMIARNRFNRFDECNILLSKLTSEDASSILAFYEWINPKTGKGGGAFPFRTGICAARLAIDHVLEGIEKKRKRVNTGVSSV